MAKDPAFLFYYQDFLVGTEFMTNAEVGQYIRVLAHLADKGKLSEEQVLSICRASAIPSKVQDKLSVGDDGLFFNKRLLQEVEKRKAFSDSRRNNALSGKSSLSTSRAYAQHMENENENRNEDKDKIKSREVTEKDFEPVWKLYPNRQGKKEALRHFLATVKTLENLTNIRKALTNYLKSERVSKGFIQNGSTWFNDWECWIEPSGIMMKAKTDGSAPRVPAIPKPTHIEVDCDLCDHRHYSDEPCKNLPASTETPEEIRQKINAMIGEKK